MKPFPWRAGMISIDGHRVLAVSSDGLPSVWAVERYGAPRIIPHQPFMGDVWTRARPDPKDGATLGAFLDAIAEAWSAPLTSLYWCNVGGWTVAITGRTATEQGAVTDATFTGDTQFDALMKAWEAAP